MSLCLHFLKLAAKKNHMLRAEKTVNDRRFSLGLFRLLAAVQIIEKKEFWASIGISSFQ